MNLVAAAVRRWILGSRRCPSGGAVVAALIAFCGIASADDKTSPPGLQPITFHAVSYFLRDVDTKKDDVRLFLKDDHGAFLHDFAALEKFTSGKGEKLLFAANAGMFQADFSPVGLLVLDGAQLAPLNTDDGPGNFFIKPNGVFLINQKHEARIVNSADYVDELSPAVWATQSGPMLLLRGDINADFNASSKSLKIRSGVGVRKDGIAVFALSRQPVSFYDFAALFRDKLLCRDALYLGGDVSEFYVPGMKHPNPQTFGPMIGVVAKIP